MRFHNRADAGRQLALQLDAGTFVDPVVLALPRGGVPVAAEVARSLGAPLDVFVARKIGMPGHPEFGIGAISEENAVIVNNASVQAMGVSREDFAAVVEAERRELDRRVRHYRGNRALPALSGRDVVLVDDGLATGVTAEAALRSLKGREPRRLVLAVPVAPPDTARRLAEVADEVVCVRLPTDFRAVGVWYDDFDQTTDDEVLRLLGEFSQVSGTGEAPSESVEKNVRPPAPFG